MGTKGEPKRDYRGRIVACERCGGPYDYMITPCMSKLCTACTDLLVGVRKK